MKDSEIKKSKPPFDPVAILCRKDADRAYSAPEFEDISGYGAQTCTRHCVEAVKRGDLIVKKCKIGCHRISVYALNNADNLEFFKDK